MPVLKDYTIKMYGRVELTAQNLASETSDSNDNLLAACPDSVIIGLVIKLIRYIFIH
jgi:hypothetical protein